jgi:hypothetical protein
VKVTLAFTNLALGINYSFSTFSFFVFAAFDLKDHVRVLSKPLVLYEPEDFFKTTLIKDFLVISQNIRFYGAYVNV